MYRIAYLVFVQIFLLALVSCNQNSLHHVTKDNGARLILSKGDLSFGIHHKQHSKVFGKYVSGYNSAILQGIDNVQATADSGGGYFIGIKAVPTESPLSYPVQFLGKGLLEPPRTTSYCSGSSFGAFMEGMNILFQNSPANLDAEHYEALRMQEPDGGRREDHIKFWGKWNADGYGNHFALAQYTKIGKHIQPIQARPGDFMNISWTNGGGHSVVFLGWYLEENDIKHVAFWSSQRSTNGFGDLVVPIERIKEIMVIRLVNPENIFSFNIYNEVSKEVKGDKIKW